MLIRLAAGLFYIVFFHCACYSSKAPEGDGSDIAEDTSCPDGWTKIVHAEDDSYCVSSYMGMGNCCEAFEICHHAYTYSIPGLWPPFHPANTTTLPPDFYLHMELPGLVISDVHIYDFGGASFQISCVSEAGQELWSEEDNVWDEPDPCSQITCEAIEQGSCASSNFGCSCRYPIWCVTDD